MPNFQQIPFYRFFKIAASNGGLSLKGLLHLAPWVVKTTLLEPLRWIESIKHTKRINSYNISQPPLFILGYYRSGTTYLQRMFMQDDSLGYTSIFQTILPEVMLTCEKGMTPVLDRISRICRMRNHFHRIPFIWDHFPGEEDVALTSMLLPGASQWGALFPKQSANYLRKYVLMKDITPQVMEEWKKNYLFLLKKISMANNGKRLVLKNPPNTARIKLLLSLFPDAKFIHIARDPFEVFASTRRFWEVIMKNYVLGSSHSVNTDELILDSYSGIMQQYLEQRDFIPQKQLYEIRYEDFIRRPVSTMKTLYEALDMGDFELCKSAMTRFADQQKQYALLQHQLDEETKNIIAQKWAPYIQLLSEQIKVTPFQSPAPGN